MRCAGNDGRACPASRVRSRGQGSARGSPLAPEPHHRSCVRGAQYSRVEDGAYAAVIAAHFENASVATDHDATKISRPLKRSAPPRRQRSNGRSGPTIAPASTPLPKYDCHDFTGRRLVRIELRRATNQTETEHVERVTVREEEPDNAPPANVLDERAGRGLACELSVGSTGVGLIEWPSYGHPCHG